jgi:hypothetical protein
MRSAAKFHRVAVERAGHSTDLQHTYGVAIFLTEKLNDVFSLSRFCERNFSPRNGRILADFLVHEFFDIALLFRRERRA